MPTLKQIQNRAKAKRYALAHPVEVAFRKRDWERRHPEKLKRQQARASLKRNGLDPALADLKPKHCVVCRETTKIGADHCHKKGTFRGWLCRRCNLILGHAKDKPKLLRKLAMYLET